jgi:hypothetical protein
MKMRGVFRCLLRLRGGRVERKSSEMFFSCFTNPYFLVMFTGLATHACERSPIFRMGSVFVVKFLALL